MELWIALVLTAGAIAFHVVRAVMAGGLWRDEAATAHLASNFSFSYVRANSQYELFPVLVPCLLHVYSFVAGGSDVALRIFGGLVGCIVLASLWWNMRVIGRGVPLISLALLGYNAGFIRWGDEIRGYGLGMVFLLFTIGLCWRAIEKPTAMRIAGAMLSGVASVQCLFNNSCLVLVACLGLAVVALLRRSESRAALAVLLGVPAALSLLPYVEPLARARDWDMLVRGAVDIEMLCLKFWELLASAGWWVAAGWVVLILLALACSALGQLKVNHLGIQGDERHALAFSGFALLFGIVAYFTLLLAVGYPTQVWYYLVPAAFTALFLDLVFGTLRQKWVPTARISAALVLAAVSVQPTIQQVQLRQTNADLVATKIEQVAQKSDLVVVTPWYDGISFDRYYHGPGEWLTIPDLSFHKFHRYDLVKAQMVLLDQAEAVRPVMDRITRTLNAGHRVWLIGPSSLLNPDQEVPDLQPAPDPKWGWHDEMYTLAWTARLTQFLQLHADVTNVAAGPDGRISSLECLSIRMFQVQRN